LAPNDYIFPAVGANGVVQVGEHVSHDDMQKWIDEFATGAQLPRRNGNFTKHCLRRGGAQYTHGGFGRKVCQVDGFIQ
ncbi:hypothetical protein GGX14DRAFT_372010, partial [Mycena pura]